MSSSPLGPEEVRFTVPGRPVAKGRPKFARIGPGVRAYTPEQTREHETSVRALAANAMNGRPLITGPVHLHVRIYVACPVSWSGKRRAEAIRGEIRATKKPDASNVVKSIEDGCDCVVWRSDSQIVQLVAEKWFGDQPRTEVVITEIDARPAP